MRTAARTFLGLLTRRLAAVASVGAVVAALAVAGGGGIPGGTVVANRNTPAVHSWGAAQAAPQPSRSAYVSTEFAGAKTSTEAASAPVKPQPPTQAPLAEVLAQHGHHTHRGPNGETDVNICSYATPPGYAHCDAHVRTDTHAGAAAPSATIGNGGPYDPAYLRSAYNAPSATGGSGQTVAIAIAY